LEKIHDRELDWTLRAFSKEVGGDPEPLLPTVEKLRAVSSFGKKRPM